MPKMSDGCKGCAWYYAAKDYCNRQKMLAARRPGCGFRPAIIDQRDRHGSEDIREWL